VLQVITRTPDVALAFQTLARRLTRIVRCDRVQLALVAENGQRLQTFTARAGESERRNRPRPELEFSLDRSLVGQAVREQEPLVVDDLAVVALMPIAEILAVAHVVQQAQMALARYRTVEAMSELTLSIANDINSALQIIIGHCDLLERTYPDPALQRDLAMVIRQAQRIAELLEKMRVASTERLRETAASVEKEDIPSSPEMM
jgi:nitrogen-specific signal transduction histidine kinase